MNAPARYDGHQFSFDQMAWAEPIFRIEEVNAAARTLVRFYGHASSVPDEQWKTFDENFDVVNNWRLSQNFPLNTFQVNLRAGAKKFDDDALVAQRIKRFLSIVGKLERLPTMKLTQM